MIANAKHLRREADIAYSNAAQYYEDADEKLKAARMIETKRKIMIMGGM